MIDLKLFFIVLFLIGLFPLNLYSQSTINIDSEHQKRTFESTFWEPKKGVKLLNKESALATWNKYSEQCGARKVEEHSKLRSLVVFQTEAFYIFVFTQAMWNHEPDWIICDRKTLTSQFIASHFSGGYNLEQTPPEPSGTCAQGDTSTNVRFREYAKGEPLLLEVYIQRCQADENHHEMLFHIDQDDFSLVPGSHMSMDDHYSSPFIWWYATKKYKRFGDLSWNENNERVWERELEARPSNYSHIKGAKHTQQCHYSKKSREVRCEYKLKSKASIPYICDKDINFSFWFEHKSTLNNVGLIYSKELKDCLEHSVPERKTSP